MSVLSIHQPLRFVTKTTLAEVTELFEIAKFFNAKVITLHLAAAAKLVFDKTYIEGVKQLENKYNISVAYENSQKHMLRVGKSYVWKAPDFFKFVSNMGFHTTLDTTHFGTAKTDIVTAFKNNKENIINIHLGDYRDHLFSTSLRPTAYTHLPLGKGTLPIKNFLKTLKQERYKGLITMEIDHVGYQEICKNAEYIQRLIK